MVQKKILPVICRWFYAGLTLVAFRQVLMAEFLRGKLCDLAHLLSNFTTDPSEQKLILKKKTTK